MKSLADKAKEVEAKFDEGQQIFRRPSVSILLARIQSLEIAAQQGVQRTAKKRKPRPDKYNPRDIAILGGDPSL